MCVYGLSFAGINIKFNISGHIATRWSPGLKKKSPPISQSRILLLKNVCIFVRNRENLVTKQTCEVGVLLADKS